MKYFKISNADGKQWIMPTHNMSVGMQLYQPLAWKGKLLKKWFPTLNSLDCLGIFRKILHIEYCQNPISDSLDSRLQSLYDDEKLEYSVFNGTPCAHQKVTIQIYKGEKILGYCKVTDNPELIDIFKREESYLSWLKSSNVDGVPECLCCEEIDNGKWIFVQSTIKSKTSKTTSNLSDSELEFLKNLSENTIQELQFDQTDMYSWIKRLNNSMLGRNKDVVNAIKTVEDYYNKNISLFSAYHSDFTPWNMFVEKGKLFVFDWEYAGKTYLPYLDIIHHLVQTCIFGRKADASCLFSMLFVDNKDLLQRYFDNPHIAVLSYLLDILSKYSARDEGHETNDTIMLQKEKLELVNLVLSDYSNEK